MRCIGILILGLVVLTVTCAVCCAGEEEPWSWKQGFSREVLQNGMVVRVHEDATRPLVCLLIGVKGGAGTAPEEYAGLTSLLCEAVFHGSRNFKGYEVYDLAERHGIELRGFPTYDGCYFRARFLAEDLELALNMISDAVLHPELGALQVRNAKMGTRMELMRGAVRPAPLSVSLMLRLLYPGHRYAIPIQGEPERARYVSHEDVVEYYKLNFQPRRTVLAVAGDVNTEEIMQMVRDRFESWRVRNPEAVVPALPEPERSRFYVTTGGGKQVYITVGVRSAPRTSEDTLPLEALVYVLGGDHPNAKLYSRLVQEESIASEARMRLSRRSQEAPVYASITTGRQTVYGAVADVIEEIDNVRNGGISNEDLQAAKDFLMGEQAVFENSLFGKVDLIVQQELYDLPVDYWELYPEKVNALTTDDLVRIARTYLDPEAMVGGVVTGYPDVVINQLEEFGEVEQVNP